MSQKGERTKIRKCETERGGKVTRKHYYSDTEHLTKKKISAASLMDVIF